MNVMISKLCYIAFSISLSYSGDAVFWLSFIIYRFFSKDYFITVNPSFYKIYLAIKGSDDIKVYNVLNCYLILKIYN